MQHNYNANPFALLGCKVEVNLVPSNHETWVPHTASCFYIGNAWDHYHCHKIYINCTRHTRTCNTVFFKHKYLTMPTLTPADALIQAVNNLISAIAGIVPPPSMTTDTIGQLMHIFKQQAETAKNNATVQRVLKSVPTLKGCSPRQNQIHKPTTTPRAAPTANPTTSFPDLEFKYPDRDVGQPRQTPVVSQDDHKSVSPPSANTRHQYRRRTIT